MKRKTIAIIVAAGLFVLLFAGRFASELMDSREQGGGQLYGDVLPMSQSAEAPVPMKRNYASERIQVGAGPAGQVVDQKYEQAADLYAKSRDFEADAKRLRSAAESIHAVVQRESSGGLPGARRLELVLGVVPEAFDRGVEALKGIGILLSFSVTKNDKTGEYRELEARRLSLEKSRDALKDLRRPGAALGDLVALETKILEMEGQIQELGVSLGDFGESASFCTLNATLVESEKAATTPARVLDAALSSLGWATLVESGLAFILISALGTLGLGAWTLAKIRAALAGPGKAA